MPNTNAPIHIDQKDITTRYEQWFEKESHIDPDDMTVECMDAIMSAFHAGYVQGTIDLRDYIIRSVT